MGIEKWFCVGEMMRECKDCVWRIESKHYTLGNLLWVQTGWGWTCPKVEMFSSTPCKYYKRKWYLFWRPK